MRSAGAVQLVATGGAAPLSRPVTSARPGLCPFILEGANIQPLSGSAGPGSLL